MPSNSTSSSFLTTGSDYQKSSRKKVLIDRRDILNDMLTYVAPNYFVNDLDALDKNLVSLFGYINDVQARAIEDTLILENSRAQDYCPELSYNEYHVRQTARLRNFPIAYAQPATALAMLHVLKEDILQKGERIGEDYYFVIDRRSEIINNQIYYSLEDDILIRAIKNHSTNDYVYTAVYTGTNRQYRTFVQIADAVNESNEDELLISLTVYQQQHNIQEQTVVDKMNFLCDGLEYEYQNKLVDFDVYWRASDTDEYVQLPKKHKLAEPPDDTLMYIDYVDDEPGVITIYDNPDLNINVNSGIRVEIIESLGVDGNTPIGTDDTTFTLYTDGEYNYSGVQIDAMLVTDPSGGVDGDDIDTLKHRLIVAKTTRDNITTMLDIHNYIDDNSANVQIVKKRNDIVERHYCIYTLIRLNDLIAPAVTKNIVCYASDFDIEYGGKIRGISANNRWYLDEADDVLRPYPAEEPETPYDYVYNVPYMIRLDEYNTLQYYNPNINAELQLGVRVVNDSSPYQFITNLITVRRDAVDPDDNTARTYYISVTGTMNTSSDNLYVNKAGMILDNEKFRGFMILKSGGNPRAYLPLTLSSYEPKNRAFTMEGSFRIIDYITDNNSVPVESGLYTTVSGEEYTSYIDFKETYFDVVFFYKSGEETEGIDIITTYNAYQDIPGMNNYFWMNTYQNREKFNFIVEMNQYCRSALTIRQETSVPEEDPLYGELVYIIDEVPAFEYNYSIENSQALYPIYQNLHTTYTGLMQRCTDFDLSLKFINTYGPSKYINIIGTEYDPGESEFAEVSAPLQDLNPVFSFKVYGTDVNANEIRDYILEFFRETYITEDDVFISNLCSQIEETFDIVSIKFLGLVTKKRSFDATYQHMEYTVPMMLTDSLDGLIEYVPEQLNVTDIVIDIDEIDT